MITIFVLHNPGVCDAFSGRTLDLPLTAANWLFSPISRSINAKVRVSLVLWYRVLHFIVIHTIQRKKKRKKKRYEKP